MRTFALLVLAALALPLLALGAPPATAQDLYAQVDGPLALAPGQIAGYNVSIFNGPAGPDLNYIVDFYLVGSDLAGGSPLESSPGRVTGNQNLVKVNITAPAKEQEITLVVKVNARAGDVEENATADTPIEIIASVVLSATFRNDSPTAAVNVTVRFYVDGRFVGSQTIARIEPTGESTATFSWVPLDLGTGVHEVRVEADLDGNGIIDPARGELRTTELFLRESAGLNAGWNIVLGVALFVLAFLVAVAVRRRKQA